MQVGFCKPKKNTLWAADKHTRRRKEEETLTSLTETEGHDWHGQRLYDISGNVRLV